MKTFINVATPLMLSIAVLSGCTSQPTQSTPTEPPRKLWSNPFEELRTMALDEVKSFSMETATFLKTNNQEKTISTSSEAIRQKMKDPASAMFRNVRIVNYLEGKLICGEINSKNSYGGYVGFTKFVASPTDSTLLSTSSRYESSNDAANAGLYAACGK
jgi:hypothetical protein